MFGMGIFEILVILIVAVIFLGPEKLPQAMVDVVKFFKAVKKTLNDAKDTFDKEIQINEMKKEVLEYKNHFESSMEGITKDVELKEIDTMFAEYKEENNPALPKPKKLSKAPQELIYEEKIPKKRGRKPKNSDETKPIKVSTKAPRAPQKSSTKAKTSKAEKSLAPREVAPKVGRSAGFKKSSKPSTKES